MGRRLFKESTVDKKAIEIDVDKCLITGVSLCNNENEDKFKVILEDALNETNALSHTYLHFTEVKT